MRPLLWANIPHGSSQSASACREAKSLAEFQRLPLHSCEIAHRHERELLNTLRKLVNFSRPVHVSVQAGHHHIRRTNHLIGYVYRSGEVHELSQSIQKFSLMTVGDRKST